MSNNNKWPGRFEVSVFRHEIYTITGEFKDAKEISDAIDDLVEGAESGRLTPTRYGEAGQLNVIRLDEDDE